MNRKGKGVLPWVIVAVVVMVALVGFGWMYFQQQETAAINQYQATLTTQDTDGEWDKIYDPDEVSGTDLTITEQTIADGTTYEDGTGPMYTTSDLNGTDGVTSYLAFGIEVDGQGGLQNVDIDGSLGTEAAVTEIEIRKAYILPDEKGINLDESDATYIGDVDTDQDEFEFDISQLDEGDYVMCVEVKGITTSTLASGDDLITIDFDGSSDDGDVEDFVVEIQNAAAS